MRASPLFHFRCQKLQNQAANAPPLMRLVNHHAFNQESFALRKFHNHEARHTLNAVGVRGFIRNSKNVGFTHAPSILKRENNLAAAKLGNKA